MLYPDLRCLPLVCPTGMPLPSGTHNHEAGGSNDPPPPAAGPAQRAALAQADIVFAILLALGDGDFADVCKAAARWCHLNKTNMAACNKKGVWEQLTSVVFPNARKPNTGRHGRSDAPYGFPDQQQPPPDEPEGPKDWFFYICTQYKKRDDLIKAWHDTAFKRAKTLDDETVECVKLLLRYNKLEYKVQYYQTHMRVTMAWRGPMELQLRLAANIERMQNEMAALSDELDEKCFSKPARLTGYSGQPRTENETRLLEALERQKAYLRDINQDPEMQGPHTLGDEILRSRISYLEFVEAKHKREREERRERERQQGFGSNYAVWLAAQERMNPREATLSRRVAEAKALLARAEQLTVPDNAKKMVAQVLARIEEERRLFHTFANAPDRMVELQDELARQVRWLEIKVGQVSDESVTVEDLFGSEDEDGQD